MGIVGVEQLLPHRTPAVQRQQWGGARGRGGETKKEVHCHESLDRMDGASQAYISIATGICIQNEGGGAKRRVNVQEDADITIFHGDVSRWLRRRG